MNKICLGLLGALALGVGFMGEVKPVNACKAGFFPNLLQGNVKCAADMGADEVRKAGIEAVNPTYWTSYATFNTLKETGIIKSGAQCYAYVEAAKAGGMIAGTAYSVPPQVTGAIATMASGTAKKACDSSFGVPSQQDVEAARISPPNGASASSVDRSQYDAGVKIAELQMRGKVEEARIVNDTQLKLEQAKQQEETERVQIVQSTLERMNQSNNDADIREAELALEGKKDDNKTTVELGQQILTGKKDDNRTTLAVTGVKTLGGILGDVIKVGGSSKDIKTRADADVRIAEINAKAQVEAARIKAEADARQLPQTQYPPVYQPQQPVYQQPQYPAYSQPLQVATNTSSLPGYMQLVAQPITAITQVDINQMDYVLNRLNWSTKPVPTSCSAPPNTYVLIKYGVLGACVQGDNFHVPGTTHIIQ